MNAMKKKKINIDGKIIILWKREIILNEIKKYFEIIINRNLESIVSIRIQFQFNKIDYKIGKYFFDEKIIVRDRSAL